MVVPETKGENPESEETFTVAIVEEPTPDGERLEVIDDSLYDSSKNDKNRVEFEVSYDDPLADALRENGFTLPE